MNGKWMKAEIHLFVIKCGKETPESLAQGRSCRPPYNNLVAQAPDISTLYCRNNRQMREAACSISS